MCFKLQRNGTWNGSSSIKDTFTERLQPQMTVLYHAHLQPGQSAAGQNLFEKKSARRILKNLNFILYNCYKSSETGKGHTFLVSLAILLSDP